MDYRKPPIIEAIIEFQFAGDCSPQIRGKVARRLKKSYPFEESIQEIIVEGAGIAMRQAVSPMGIRLSSSDRASIFSLSSTPSLLPPMAEIRSSSFSASQLAPYVGWDDFIVRFFEGWAVVEKHTGHRKLNRIGVRYVNRIDIPGTIENPTSWVRIGPTLPDDFEKPLGFALSATIPVGDARANLGTAIVQSPLPHHASIMLDRNETRREILEDFRIKKNSIFESCITDEARRLFQ
jgi:uncharacterized protein (TIGR04255 family)